MFAVAGVIIWAIELSIDNRPSYQWVEVEYTQNGDFRYWEGWVHRHDDPADRWEIPQENVITVERSECYRAEDPSELPTHEMAQCDNSS